MSDFDHCLEPSEVVHAQDAPPGDPRRQHLESCPRCRALLHAWREFLDPSAPTDQAALVAADLELAARLQRGGRMRPRQRGDPGRSGAPAPLWLRRGPLYGVAAALLVCAMVVGARDLTLLRARRLPAGTGALRGDATAGGEVIWSRAGAGSQLSWQPPTGATDAIVILYDRTMHELTRMPAGGATNLTLEGQANDPAATFAQVVFLAERDTLARSGIVTPR